MPKEKDINMNLAPFIPSEYDEDNACAYCIYGDDDAICPENENTLLCLLAEYANDGQEYHYPLLKVGEK